MKRLVELSGSDPLTARAQALVDAMGRTLESEERLLRVRRSLDTPVRAGAPRWVWRGALALVWLGSARSRPASGAGWWSTPGAPQMPRRKPRKGGCPATPRAFVRRPQPLR